MRIAWNPHLICPEERIRTNFEPLPKKFAKYLFDVLHKLLGNNGGDTGAMLLVPPAPPPGGVSRFQVHQRGQRGGRHRAKPTTAASTTPRT